MGLGLRLGLGLVVRFKVISMKREMLFTRHIQLVALQLYFATPGWLTNLQVGKQSLCTILKFAIHLALLQLL